MRAGSCERAAEVAAGALLRIGATNLQAKLGAQVAAYGEHCWVTDARMRELVRRWDGRAYHRESIGRARRQMARRGWIGSKRVMPLQKPDGAKFPSTHGTTSKWIAWQVLGVKNPMTRGERRERTKEAQKIERFESPRRGAAFEPALMALVAGVGQAPSPATRARTRTTPLARARAEQSHVVELAADARRRLEEWAKDNGVDPP